MFVCFCELHHIERNTCIEKSKERKTINEEKKRGKSEKKGKSNK